MVFTSLPLLSCELSVSTKENPDRKNNNKDVKEMDNIFNETRSNVLNNYIPHETIICDDQDPPWINNKVKKALQEKILIMVLLKKLQCLKN